MTKAHKLAILTQSLNTIGDHKGIYGTITQTEAVIFIRDLMYIANSTAQGTELADRVESSTSVLDTLLTQRRTPPIPEGKTVT